MYKKEKPGREHNKKQRLQYQIHHYRMSLIQNQWRKNNSPKYTLSSTSSSVGVIAEIGSNRIFEYLAWIIKQQRVRSLRGKVNTEANILISMVYKKAMLWQSCSNLQCKHSFFFFFPFFWGGWWGDDNIPLPLRTRSCPGWTPFGIWEGQNCNASKASVKLSWCMSSQGPKDIVYTNRHGLAYFYIKR